MRWLCVAIVLLFTVPTAAFAEEDATPVSGWWIEARLPKRAPTSSGDFALPGFTLISTALSVSPFLIGWRHGPLIVGGGFNLSRIGFRDATFGDPDSSNDTVFWLTPTVQYTTAEYLGGEVVVYVEGALHFGVGGGKDFSGDNVGTLAYGTSFALGARGALLKLVYLGVQAGGTWHAIGTKFEGADGRFTVSVLGFYGAFTLSVFLPSD